MGSPGMICKIPTLSCPSPRSPLHIHTPLSPTQALGGSRASLVPTHIHQHNAMLPAQKHLTVLRQGVSTPLKPPWAGFSAKIVIFSYFHAPLQVKPQLKSTEGCLIAWSVKKLEQPLKRFWGQKVIQTLSVSLINCFEALRNTPDSSAVEGKGVLNQN